MGPAAHKWPSSGPSPSLGDLAIREVFICSPQTVGQGQMQPGVNAPDQEGFLSDITEGKDEVHPVECLPARHAQNPGFYLQ